MKGGDKGVRDRLKAAKLKHKDIAAALGITRPAVSQMLSGERGIARWHYEGIARLLGTTVAELFAVDEKQTTAEAGAKDERKVNTPAQPTGGLDAANIEAQTRNLEEIADSIVQLARAMRTTATKLAVESAEHPARRAHRETARPAARRTAHRRAGR